MTQRGKQKNKNRAKGKGVGTTPRPKSNPFDANELLEALNHPQAQSAPSEPNTITPAPATPAVATPNDEDVLLEAVGSREFERVRRLLSDCEYPISLRIIHYAATRGYVPEIFHLIAEIVAFRRRKLLVQARTRLDPVYLFRLGICRQQEIVDTEAEPLERALKDLVGKEGLWVPATDYSFSFHQPSVYHLIEWNWHAAEILYNVGFTKVDAATPFSLPPVSSLYPWSGLVKKYLAPRGGEFVIYFSDFLRMCAWFERKGSLFSGLAGNGNRPLHHIARCIGRCVANSLGSGSSGELDETDVRKMIDQFAFDWRYVREEHGDFLKRLFINMNTQHRDTCFCACSADGCLASHIIIGMSIRGLRSARLVASIVAGLLNFDFPSDPDTEQQFYEYLAPTVFWVCAFECLGLQHTCQEDDRSTSQGWNCREQQAQQLRLRGLLASLADEFNKEYRRLGDPLPEYLTTRWWLDMGEAQRRYGVGAI